MHVITRWGAEEVPEADFSQSKDLAKLFPAVRVYCGGQFQNPLIVGGLDGVDEHFVFVKHSNRPGWVFTVVGLAATIAFHRPSNTS